MASNVTIVKATGLNTQPNELALPPGSLAVAENVEITRDDVIEVSRGFEDFSSNLPDFTPAQLISVGGVAYLHLDNGIWYYNGTNWLRKRGTFGTALSAPIFAAYSAGHLYVTTADHVVLDLNLSTGARTVLAGRFGVNSSTDGTGGAARFDTPIGVCTDGTNLYVCDRANYTIRKIVISSGVVTTLAGTAGASGSTDGTGAAARFSLPYGICTDNTNLYVSDSSNHTIRKIVISSGVVTTLAGTAGASGSTDDTGAAARFNTPVGVCTDNTNLYVCEYDNHTIRKIVISSGVVTTLAGTALSSGSTDGTGAAARFSSPTGIVTDNTNLYVSDSSNHTIRKIVISSGVVTTLAGTAGANASTDGTGAAARFDSPIGVTTDGTHLLVCDYINDLIRKVYLPSVYVTTIDGAPSLNAAGTGIPYVNGIFAGPP